MIKELKTHPLAQHHLTILRNKNTSSDNFAKSISQLGLFLAYEVTKKLKTEDIEVETPLTKTQGKKINVKVTIVPIIRAGIALIDPFRNFIPNASVGFIGMERDERTAISHEYYSKIKVNDSQMFIIVDLMLATGGSALHTIKQIKKDFNPKQIIFASIIAAPEGIKAIQDTYPDVAIFTIVIDEKLDDKKYIVPGLGDAGDRYYKTED